MTDQNQHTADQSQNRPEVEARKSDACADAIAPDTRRQVMTTLVHRGATLVGFGFVIYELLWITIFYCNTGWFPVNAIWLGIPLVFVALIVAHALFLWSETPAGCHFFSPICRGMPPVVYARWLIISPQGIGIGLRQIVWESIDELELTFFGNLLIRSRLLCGDVNIIEPAKQQLPDLILKFPFGVATTQEQKDLIALIQARRSHVVLNDRLQKRLAKVELPNAAAVYLLGVAFVFLVLLDVGQASCRLVEILKNYHLAQVAARSGDLKEASRYYEVGEKDRMEAPAWSWVNWKLLAQGPIAADLQQARGETLWMIGRKEEALLALQKSQAIEPTDFRRKLVLAKMYAEMGKFKQARAELTDAIDTKGTAFLPRAYMLALLRAEKKDSAARKLYDIYMDDLDELLFAEEPMYPPPKARMSLLDVWHREDVKFILDRLIK